MELIDIEVLQKIHYFSTQWLKFLFYFMCEESKTKLFLVSYLQILEQNLTWSPELTAKNTRSLRKPKAETIQTSSRKKGGTEAMTWLWTFKFLKLQLRLLSNATAQRQVEKVLGRFGIAVCIYQF